MVSDWTEGNGSRWAGAAGSAAAGAAAAGGDGATGAASISAGSPAGVSFWSAASRFRRDQRPSDQPSSGFVVISSALAAKGAIGKRVVAPHPLLRLGFVMLGDEWFHPRSYAVRQGHGVHALATVEHARCFVVADSHDHG